MRRKRPPRQRKEYWMRVKDPAAIRRRRKWKRFSQDELAYLVNKSQQSISLIEQGKMRTISEEFAIAIAARLDVPWEELFEAHEIEVGTAVSSDVHSDGKRVPA